MAEAWKREKKVAGHLESHGAELAGHHHHFVAVRHHVAGRLGLADANAADTAIAASALNALVAVLVDVGEVPEEFFFLGGKALHVGDGDDPVNELLDGLLVILVLVVL